MNKSGLLSLCCLILLISIIATGCMLERYVKIEEKEFVVPVGQQKEVKNRLKKINANPEILISSKDAHKHLKSLRV